ncbi:hypothetical protein EJ02DRAFT_485874, partial [Clathrospora elynae]
SDSDSSALSASNWRKTESLLRQVVKDRGDPQAQKLSQAFHSISVQKMLLEQEIQGLREALINERLRRKQGKALPLEALEEYHGGAVFWSPSKVKEARDWLQHQEAEEEQQRLRKVEATRLRDEGRQHGLKASIKDASKKRVAAQAQSGREASCAAAAPPPPQSQHGQEIKLPAKYR